MGTTSPSSSLPTRPSPITQAVLSLALVVSLLATFLILRWRANGTLPGLATEVVGPPGGVPARVTAGDGANSDLEQPAGGNLTAAACADVAATREEARRLAQDLTWRLPHLEQYRRGAPNPAATRLLPKMLRAAGWRNSRHPSPETECRGNVCRSVFPVVSDGPESARWNQDIHHLVATLDAWQPAGSAMLEEDLQAVMTRGPVIYFRVAPAEGSDGAVLLQELLLLSRDEGTVRNCEIAVGGRFRGGILTSQVENMGVGPVFSFMVAGRDGRPRTPDTVDECVLKAFHEAAIALEAPPDTTRAKHHTLLPGAGAKPGS